MATDIKVLGRRAVEQLWNKGNFAVADQLIAADYVLVDPNLPDVKGPEGIKQMISMRRQAFPDVRFQIEDQIAEGDKLVTRFTVTGTHKNDLAGIPATGKKIRVSGILISRFVGEKVVEEWATWDTLGMMQQLGLIPSA